MSKISDLEVRKAFEKWLSENPGKTVNDVPQREKIRISSGKEIKLGSLICSRRKSLKNKKLLGEKYSYWVEVYGLSIDNQLEKNWDESELEVREAFEHWLSENPGKTVNDVASGEIVKNLNGEEVNLGSLIYRRKKSLKKEKLLGDNYSYWVELHGLSIDNKLEKNRDELELEVREAFEKWLSDNPGKTVNDVPSGEIVKISSGTEVKLGSRIDGRKNDLKNGKLLGKKYSYWVESHGLSIDNKLEKNRDESELEVREAFEKWLSENPKKTVNDILQTEKIEISSGEKINLGSCISNRKKTLREGKLTGEKYQYWVDKHGLSSVNKKIEKFDSLELETREAFEYWLSENPEKTVNDISSEEIVKISNGTEINLGSRIESRRNSLKKGKLLDKKYSYWVEVHGLSIDNKFEKRRKKREIEAREAFKQWLLGNPGKTVNDVPWGEIVKISNGTEIKLGRFISDRKNDLKKGKLLDEEYSYWVKRHGLRVGAIDHNHLKEFNNDKEKASRVEKCLKDLREKRRSKKKEEWNIDNILKEFDVDLETLEKYLARTKTEETKPRAKTLEYKGKTLRSFCIENGYNYDVVARAIKLHDMCRYDTLEQLINRSLTTYNKKGQREPATWIYEKYGNLVKHVLLHLKLDSASILRDMTNYIMTLEEAVRHDVFKRNIDTKENSWLEELYNYLIEEINDNKEQKQTEEDIADMFVILVQEYKLTKEEYQELWKVFSKYVETMREYEIVDVGLETNQEKKLEKIREYNLDEYDIEESFFVPLEFDKGVLLGRQSELYKRRQLLKQYIIDWDYYTDMEKEAIRQHNNFTDEELIYIKDTREEINEVIEESNKHI